MISANSQITLDITLICQRGWGYFQNMLISSAKSCLTVVEWSSPKFKIEIWQRDRERERESLVQGLKRREWTSGGSSNMEEAGNSTPRNAFPHSKMFLIKTFETISFLLCRFRIHLWCTCSVYRLEHSFEYVCDPLPFRLRHPAYFTFIHRTGSSCLVWPNLNNAQGLKSLVVQLQRAANLSVFSNHRYYKRFIKSKYETSSVTFYNLILFLGSFLSIISDWKKNLSSFC